MAPAEAKTTECVSAAQPDTVIFCEASVAFAKVMVLPDSLEVTSEDFKPLKTRHMVPEVAATVSLPQSSVPQTAQSRPPLPKMRSFPPARTPWEPAAKAP